MNLSSSSSELDIFEYYIDTELIDKIVESTNSYYQYFIRNVDLRQHSRLQTWRDVTTSEMYMFLAITMLMTQNSRHTIEEHWSTEPLLKSDIFSTLMPRNRYCTILGMLHFSQSGPRREGDSILKKISDVVNHARQKYQESFIPYEKICIDESIVPFKGRLSIKQYLPKKRNRFGIKLFVLCDVRTGIILDFIIYCGLQTEITRFADLGVSGSVVATLIERFYGTNRKLYIDNWYSSPKLSFFLKHHDIHTCGTVNKHRSGMPKFRKLKKGEKEAKYSDPMMALKWCDKKNIHMLTTIHKDEMGPSDKIDRSTGLPIMKPECVIDYTKNMGTVDTADMMISNVQCLRKTIKWYKKLFFHLIDMHLLNSFFMYKLLNANLPERKLRLKIFQLSVIRQIIQKYGGQSASERTIVRSAPDHPTRKLPGNAAAHMPNYIPNGKKLRCKFCSSRGVRKITRFMCNVCKVALCVAPCSQLYHGATHLY